jgi:hypothetical protein
MDSSGACLPEAPHDIAVGIEDTDLGNGNKWHPLLPPRLAQERFRPKYRGRGMVLAVHDRPLGRVPFC